MKDVVGAHPLVVGWQWFNCLRARVLGCRNHLHGTDQQEAGQTLAS